MNSRGSDLKISSRMCRTWTVVMLTNDSRLLSLSTMVHQFLCALCTSLTFNAQESKAVQLFATPPTSPAPSLRSFSETTPDLDAAAKVTIPQAPRAMPRSPICFSFVEKSVEEKRPGEEVERKPVEVKGQARGKGGLGLGPGEGDVSMSTKTKTSPRARSPAEALGASEGKRGVGMSKGFEREWGQGRGKGGLRLGLRGDDMSRAAKVSPRAKGPSEGKDGVGMGKGSAREGGQRKGEEKV